jgi:type I restriction enzyme S subunit
MMRDLPSGWEDVRLDDVTQISPRKKQLPADTDVTFLGMEDVSEDAKITNYQTRQFGDVSKGYTFFEEDDVLVAKITPCFENGKGAYATNLVNGIGFGSTEFHVLRATSDIDSIFLYYWTTSYEFRVRGTNNMQGSAGQKRVPTDFVRLYRIPLPPLPEQRAIARILSTWDEAIALVGALIDALTLRKRGLMQVLLTGKVRFPGFEDEWEEVRLGELASNGLFIDGDWVESKDQDPNGDVRLIQLADIGDGDFLDKSSRYLTSDKVEELNGTYINTDDILVARMPDPIGRATLFPASSQSNITVVDVCIIRPNPDVDNLWLMYKINSDSFRHQITRRSTGTTRTRISRSNLAKIELSVPSSNEQSTIATCLGFFDNEIQKLQTYRTHLQRQKKGLMQVLLTGKVRVEGMEE